MLPTNLTWCLCEPASSVFGDLSQPHDVRRFVMILVKKVLGFVFRIAAGCVIALALVVGVARLLLPEAATLTDDIKDGVRLATGFTIDFKFISAGVSFYGPELRLQGVTITWPNGDLILAAERLAVSADVIDSIAMRKLMPERIRVAGASVDAQIMPDGELFLQGRSWRELLPPEDDAGPMELPEFRLQLEDIGFTFKNLQRDGPKIAGRAASLGLIIDEERAEVVADLSPGEELGRRLQAQAEVPLQLLTEPDALPDDVRWSLALFIEDFRLDPWVRLVDMRDLPVIGSRGDADARLKFRGWQLAALQAELDLQQVVLDQPEGGPVSLDYLEGDISWRGSADGWEASGENFSLGRAERNWPASTFNVSYAVMPGADAARYSADVSFLRLDDLVPLVRAVQPDALSEAGLIGTAAGDLSSLQAEASLAGGQLEAFRVQTGFAGLGYVSPQQGLDLAGYSGSLTANESGGDIRIGARDVRFGLRRQFRDTIELTSIDGVAVWRTNQQGYRIIANELAIESEHGEARASLELSLDREFGSPEIDLNGSARMDDISEIPGYLPLILNADVIKWLDQSLIAGTVPQASFTLRGPLKVFPFDRQPDAGDFRVEVNFVDGILDYAPDWPLLEDASGQLVFERGTLYSNDNTFRMLDIPVTNAAVRIADLRKPELVAEASAAADMTQVLELLRASPVAAELGEVFADVYASGDIQADAVLRLPILDLDAWKFDAAYTLAGVTAGLQGIDAEFSEVAGSGTVNNTFVTLPEAKAILLDDPVAVSVTPDRALDARFSHRADVRGELSVQRIWQSFGMPETLLLSGRVELDAQALFPVIDDGEASEPFRILLASDLLGGVSTVPFPLDKPALEAAPTRAQLLFPADREIDFSGQFRGFDWLMRLQQDNTGWFIERGFVSNGQAEVALPDAPGLIVNADLERLSVQDWYDAFTEEYWPAEEDVADSGEFADWEQTFALIDLRVDELFAVNHRFPDAGIKARPLDERWDLRVTGPWFAGDLLVPFEFNGGLPLELDMERLLLIEPLEGEDDYSEELDPRDFPPIRGRIQDFALDTMRFGELELDLQRTPDGLRSAVLKTRADSFTTESSTDWLVVDNAQRTRLLLELRSTDFADTLKDLDYAPYMSAESATVVASLLWEGMPDSRILTDSTGTVELTIKDGVVNEVDPGGGRLLGLVSIAALPRRLSMDFSEITESGLVFDELKGNFRIDFGDAFTCDLGLEGNIADMGVVGRIGIRSEDYDQVAVVRPHVSNLAPVAGVVLGGPAVGAATLLITQIFKKPLSGIGGSYFTITGSWDEPQVLEAANSEINTAKFSECQSGLPDLSPEETEAMEDLIQAADPPAEAVPSAPPRARIGPVEE